MDVDIARRLINIANNLNSQIKTLGRMASTQTEIIDLLRKEQTVLRESLANLNERVIQLEAQVNADKSWDEDNS